MKKNKDVVKSYVEMGRNILWIVGTFSVLAMGIAYAKWIMGSLFTVVSSLWWVFGGLLGILRPIIKTMALATVRTGLFRTQILYLTAAIRALGNESAAAWLKMLGPIALVIAACLLLHTVVQSLLHEDGFQGVVSNWMAWLTFFAGFVWNFGHNITQVFAWFTKNWKAILVDTIMFMVGGITSLMDLMLKLTGMAGGKGSYTVTSFARSILFAGLGENPMKYDTSMFKTGFGAEDMLKKQLSFLDKYLKDDAPKVIPDKPNIDFSKFIGGGAGGGGGMYSAPAHLIRGSAEHAVRMWEYAEQSRASSEAAKQTHEKKTEDLLTKIERNTRVTPMGIVLETLELK